MYECATYEFGETLDCTDKEQCLEMLVRESDGIRTFDTFFCIFYCKDSTQLNERSSKFLLPLDYNLKFSRRVCLNAEMENVARCLTIAARGDAKTSHVTGVSLS